MGLGLFGGGVGAARFFGEAGAEVTVTDKRTAADLRPSVEALADLKIRYVLERHDPDDFRGTDIVVVNPGVADDSPLVAMARGAGAQVEREINLLFKLTPHNPKLAITGSNGKSTTTAMLGAMMKLNNPATLLGGNIGKSLLKEARTVAEGTPLVLELSSFMLEGLRDLGESPQIAVVTNLSPNHLDRHRTLENYYGAKRAILDYQGAEDTAVLNADDPELSNWGAHARGRVIWVSTEFEPEGDAAFVADGHLIVRIGDEETAVGVVSELRLPGRHNLANALAASAAARAHGVHAWQIAEALANFSGLPHRLEMVARSADNVVYYNDSIATTPESAICALNAFGGPVTLIAGGYDKGSSFEDLGQAIVRKARRVILLGATASRIEESVTRAARDLRRMPEIVHARGLGEAARLAHDGAIPGEVILLSPACASYDQFRNFQERGELFRQLACAMAVSRGRAAS
ncbi:MAG: UDP-N-acetylmuramoyl-L-alanine--D-glutamate ligase [Planctomycetota bacterium]|nr:UDP-N-acetylmuramoyl-L-alanine--D-glutamate ligase [Planctomycetota bacterium]